MERARQVSQLVEDGKTEQADTLAKNVSSLSRAHALKKQLVDDSLTAERLTIRPDQRLPGGSGDQYWAGYDPTKIKGQITASATAPAVRDDPVVAYVGKGSRNAFPDRELATIVVRNFTEYPINYKCSNHEVGVPLIDPKAMFNGDRCLLPQQMGAYSVGSHSFTQQLTKCSNWPPMVTAGVVAASRPLYGLGTKLLNRIPESTNRRDLLTAGAMAIGTGTAVGAGTYLINHYVPHTIARGYLSVEVAVADKAFTVPMGYEVVRNGHNFAGIVIRGSEGAKGLSSNTGDQGIDATGNVTSQTELARKNKFEGSHASVQEFNQTSMNNNFRVRGTFTNGPSNQFVFDFLPPRLSAKL